MHLRAAACLQIGVLAPVARCCPTLATADFWCRAYRPISSFDIPDKGSVDFVFQDPLNRESFPDCSARSEDGSLADSVVSALSGTWYLHYCCPDVHGVFVGLCACVPAAQNTVSATVKYFGIYNATKFDNLGSGRKCEWVGMLLCWLLARHFVLSSCYLNFVTPRAHCSVVLTP